MKREEPSSRVPDHEGLLEEIRTLAYQIYERRQAEGVAGDEITDWFEAETQVRAKHVLQDPPRVADKPSKARSGRRAVAET